jgi:putative ABC transport system permease protein
MGINRIPSRPERTGQPPRWIDRMIDRLAPVYLSEEIRGDMMEMFLEDRHRHGIHRARLRYAARGLGFLSKRFFWKKSPNTQIGFPMIRSYFKMASRNLAAHKSTAIINALGLIIGIASTLVIITVIRYELSFDSFHTNAERIYRIVRVSGEDMSEFRTGVSYPVPRALEDEISSLEKITSLQYFGGAYVDILNSSGTSIRKFREEGGCALVEPSFFSMFDFKGTPFRWLAGNPKTALEQPMSVVLTRSIAKKYFGDEDPLGQTLQFQTRWDAKVTGVIEDLPPNSDFPMTILISYSSLLTLNGSDQMQSWSSVSDNHHTYVVLPENTTPSEMESEIAKVHAAHTPDELHNFRHYLLQPLKDVHTDARFGNFNGRTISRDTILALALIGAFLLLVGSINYINLTTAQSTVRAREIGLRKVMGGYRSSLIFQLLAETFLLVLVAGVLALVTSEVLIFNLQSLLNLQLTRLNLADPAVWLIWGGIIMVITLLAGLYPSVSIARINPIAALKNKFSTQSIGGISLRKLLVVVQFTITQILVVATFIVVSQMEFFQRRDMGFNREAIVNIRMPDRIRAHREALENQLRSQPFVQEVSFSFSLPSGVERNRSYMDIGRADASAMSDYQVYEYQAIDPHYLDLYQIKLLAGRNLTFQDSSGNILINKTLVRNLALQSPEEAIGQELKMGGGESVTVVGVVDDFYSNSLKEGVDNMVMSIRPRSYAVVSVKLAGGEQLSLPEAVKQIEKRYSSVFPDVVFTSSFFEDNVRAFYAQEQKYAQLFQLFSFVFLSIGCLGLYGLITFTVNRKGKEVAVRKVLGATILNILSLFSREYALLIVISFVLAVPVAYYGVDSWLSNFAEQIPLSWWLFVVPGFSILLIAVAVVVGKSLGTANANPVEKLKYE